MHRLCSVRFAVIAVGICSSYHREQTAVYFIGLQCDEVEKDDSFSHKSALFVVALYSIFCGKVHMSILQ